MKKQLTVNRTEVLAEVAAGEYLLQTLRERLHLYGTKIGCEVGECGACTVLIGGRPRLACITLTARVNDAVTTVEGLGLEADSLRRSFAEEGAFQCGYCTPGQLVNAHFVAHGDDDTQTIRRRISGNICRCTGYAGIVRAIQRQQADQSRKPGVE